MSSPARMARNAVARFRHMDEVGTATNAALRRVRGEVGELRQRLEETQREQAQLLRDLRTVVNTGVRRTTLNSTRTRVVFLVHNAATWDTWSSLVSAMQSAPDFEPIVVTIPRTFPGSTGPEQEQRNHHELERLGVPHLRVRARDLGDSVQLIAFLEPDLIFRQSQWEPDVVPAYSTEALAFARLCYLPYEVANLVKNVRVPGGPKDSAVDMPLHRAAWLVLHSTERMRRRAERRAWRRDDNVAVVGHPKIDALRDAVPFWPLNHPAGRHRVVWSAHHSVGEGWTGFGLFHQAREPMLEWAAAHPEIEVLFMPHPALADRIQVGDTPVSVEEWRDWRTRWMQLPNTGWCEDADYAGVLAAADVVLTDGLSMLLEPQVTGTPVVFMERPGHRPLNRIGRTVVATVHTAPGVAAAIARTQQLLDHGEDAALVGRRQAMVHELFGDPGAVDRILTELRARIALERAPAGEGDLFVTS